MSGRGGSKRRGRPPKTPSMERGGGGAAAAAASTPGKFQYHLLKKPKYLLNRGSDSQLSTPTASRASSPHDSTDSSRHAAQSAAAASASASMPRPSTSRMSVTGGSARKGRTPAATPVATGKRGKAAQSATPYSKKEYLYGSDFGESSDEADVDDDMLASQSDEDSLIGDAESESDFSLSSFSSCTAQLAKRQRQPTPEPLWLQQRTDLPALELPATSDDLLLPLPHTLRTAAVYEIMRRFKYLMRLTPFRLEDLCAALASPDQSALLVEVHIALMKAILREEDSQATHFGPADQKDSVNISLYLMDSVTWPEVLRSYVDSDAANDRHVVDILANSEYPYTSIDNRLTVLQFLTDQFLNTTAVREDICKEGPIHYDDHCRICHRLGDLLCCETCPAVFHLECVDPPLVNVPTEDWQCGICKQHQIAGVYDCISAREKQGLLCRQDHLGYDRHGRKYWFIARRVFVETLEGDQIWYYSSVEQLEQLLLRLDGDEMEKDLHAELSELKEEIERQMEITQRLTDEMKGNKRSYLEQENARLQSECRKTIEGGGGDDVEMKEAAEEAVASCDETKAADKIDVEGDSDSSTLAAKHTTRLKTGTLVQKSYADDSKRIKTAVVVTSKDAAAATGDAPATAAAASTVASTAPATAAVVPSIANNLLFRLGMENTHKSYSNQFTTSPIALNKPQRNEERDKKRHLSHKFSLTTASEFKWTGQALSTGSQVALVAAIRSTLLSLEQTVSSTFMHPNWSMVRKQWLAAVTAAGRPIDFAKVMVILMTCLKSPIFANVWHEQLGHVRLQRITAADREEKKKAEKREKREKDDEEERNRLSVNFVKYSLGLKHQVWKQKGEEYRIHGQWGWVWMSYGRRRLLPRPAAAAAAAATPSATTTAAPATQHGGALAERITTHKVMVPIERAGIRKIIGVRASTYEYLRDCRAKIERGEEVAVPEDVRNVRLVETISAFAELDVSKALAAPGRLLYPKQAKKSKLDDLLAHRVALRDAEELKLKEMKPEPSAAAAADATAEAAAAKAKAAAATVALLPPAKIYSQTSIEKQLTKIIANRAAAAAAAAQPTGALANIDMEFVNALAKSIQAARQQFGQLNRFGKQYRCYAKECNNQNATVFSLPQSAVVSCYSALCLQKSRVKRELLGLLRKAHTAGNGSKETVSAIMAIVNRRPTLLEQKLNEQKAAAAAAAAASGADGAAARADDPTKMQKDFREACTISYVYEEEDVSDCIALTDTKPALASADADVKMKEEPPAAAAAAAAIKCETAEPMEQETVVFDDQQGSSVAEVEVGGDSAAKDDSCEIKLDSPDAKRRRVASEVSSTIEIPSDDDEPPPAAQPESQVEHMKTRRRKSPRNVRATRSLTTTTTTTTSRTTVEYDDGSVEEESNSSTKTRSRDSATDGKRSVTTLTQRHSVGASKYVSHPNRRFAATASKSIKKEECTQIVSEYGANGSERVYTVSRSAGRIYLKKTLADAAQPAARVAVSKLPVINSHLTRRGTRSLMVLPRHELVKLARCGGRNALSGFHPLAKTNNGCWPYPSSRPQFKTAWFYRTMTMRSLSAAALQLRIVWCCLRWDDMSTRPPTSDGKHQVTTETEIMSLELLKMRHCGRFSERTQYLRRKVVIPLELPKTIREFTSIRSGLRKRKRAESPQKTDPQVSEEWVDEDKLELWEIKQFGEKQERANIALLPITRTSTGKLPVTRQAPADNGASTSSNASSSGNGGHRVMVSSKATPDEIKEKMEQQLRIQREAHHRKRALEMKNAANAAAASATATVALAAAAATTSAPTTAGSVLVAVPADAAAAAAAYQQHQPLNHPFQLYPPLQPTNCTTVLAGEEGADDEECKDLLEARAANTTAGGAAATNAAGGDKPHFIGQRKIVVKNPDGTTKIIQQNIPAPAPLKQQAVSSDASSQSASPTPNSNAQKVQIIRGPDGKVSVRGLNPGQQLIQMPDGKLHVLTSGQASAALASGQAKSVIRAPAATSAASPAKMALLRTATPTTTTPTSATATGAGIGKPVLVRQQQLIKGTGTPVVLNKGVARATATTPTILPQQQQRVIVNANQQLIPAKSTQQVTSSSAQKTIVAAGGKVQILNKATNLQQLLTQGGGGGGGSGSPGPQKIILQQAGTANRVVVQTVNKQQQQQQPQQQQLVQQQQQQQLVQVHRPAQQAVVQQQQQQQQLIMGSPGSKIMSQYQNNTSEPQHVLYNGQRILLAPGQRIVTHAADTPQLAIQQQVQQQQQVQPQQQQHQLVQQVVQQQPQQQQLVVQQVQQASPNVQPQLITNNSSLAQQLAQGKLQVASVNGQQVIIKPLGNNQAQIVAHIKTQNDGQAHIVTSAMSSVGGASDQQPDSTTEQLQLQQQQQQQQQKMLQQPEQQQQQQMLQQLPQQQQVVLSPQSQSVPASPVAGAGSTSSQLAPTIEQSLLQGQPPGTVIKCVTAQVIQTPQGPRIVLQGLAGNDFTPQQLSLVQQQVKQQLLKAQETSGKTGVLGPTKIYLAVQPAIGSATTAATTAQSTAGTSQPPPLTPVQSPQQQTQPSGVVAATILTTAVTTVPTAAVASAATTATTPKQLVRIVTNGTTPASVVSTTPVAPVPVRTTSAAGSVAAATTAATTSTTTPVVMPTITADATTAANTTTISSPTPATIATSATIAAPLVTASAAADVKSQLAQKVLANKQNKTVTDDGEKVAAIVMPDVAKDAGGNSFVVTPDYIQQTIKNALKQENLNPEIEEKLLNLQRYQEKQMKSDDVHNNHSIPGSLGSARLSAALASSPATTTANSSSTAAVSQSPAKPSGSGNGSRKRTTNQRSPLDDDEWVLDTPKRRPPAAGAGGSAAAAATAASGGSAGGGGGKSAGATPSKKSAADALSSTETSPLTPVPVNKRSLAAKKRESDKKKAALAAQMRLVRNKDLLKRAIMKKRVLLETELQMEVQRELKVEQANAHARAVGGAPNNTSATSQTAAFAATATIPSPAAAPVPQSSPLTTAKTTMSSANKSAAGSPRKSAASVNTAMNKENSKSAAATAAAINSSSTTAAGASVVAPANKPTPDPFSTAADAKSPIQTAASTTKPDEPQSSPTAETAPVPAKNALTPANPGKRRPVPTHKATIKTNKPDTTTPPRGSHRSRHHRPNPPNKSGGSLSRKKEKLFCLCRTPYDDTKFYVGCDLCNNWFHGECVGITESASKQLSEFVCGECKHARDTQELYCLCRKPYDESQFYICCDKCQDWFHGRCVGIVQSEADNIDEYICPKCQQNTAVNVANMKSLTPMEYEHLRKMIKQIQAHKSAWPFMEPVDADEAPDYYRVIKDPMDLQKIEKKIAAQDYVKLSEFIGDMTKIFDNCRFYNAKESSFYRCAESLEGFFVQRIKHFRDTLAAVDEKTAAAAATEASPAAEATAASAVVDAKRRKTAAVDCVADKTSASAIDESTETTAVAAAETATTTTTTTAAESGADASASPSDS